MNIFIHILVFLLGLALVVRTLFSALSTFVLPRAAPSRLNRVVFWLLRRIFEIPLHLMSSFAQRGALMAYYAPVGLMLLVPAWSSGEGVLALQERGTSVVVLDRRLHGL